MRKYPLRASVLLWGFALFAIIPLLAHLVVSLNNRPLRDDYCLTLGAQTFGVLGNIRHYYETWTGTYSSTFFQSVIGIAGLWRFTPFILIVLWFCTLLWALHGLYSLLLKNQSLYQYRFVLSLGTTTLLLGATINGTSNVYQAVYWTSGAITYTLPLITLTFNLGIGIRLLMRYTEASVTVLWLIVISGLSLVAGGFSPLFATAQVLLYCSLLVISAFYLPVPYRRTAVCIMISASICSVLALLILLIAPGNTVRYNSYDRSLSFIQSIIISAALTLKYLTHAPYGLLVALVMSVVGAWLYITLRHTIKPVMLIFISAITLFISMMILMSGFFIVFFSMSKEPPPRAVIVLQYSVVVMMAIVGLAYGYGLAQKLRLSNADNRGVSIWGFRFVIATVFVVISMWLGWTTYRTLFEGRLIQAFAREWDTKAAQLTAEGRGDEIMLLTFTNDYYAVVGVRPLADVPSPEICLGSPDPDNSMANRS